MVVSFMRKCLFQSLLEETVGHTVVLVGVDPIQVLASCWPPHILTHYKTRLPGLKRHHGIVAVVQGYCVQPNTQCVGAVVVRRILSIVLNHWDVHAILPSVGASSPVLQNCH